MHEFKMPSLGADMEAGKLVEWLKKPGEAIARGDIVAVVETEKGAIDVEIFETGTLSRYLVEEGTTVPVGTPLALIATEGEEAAAPVEAAKPPPAAQPVPAAMPAPTPQPTPPKIAPPGAAARIKASPAARAYAREHGIDLASVAPGKGEALRRADVEQAGVPKKAEGTRKTKPGLDLDKMRHAIAAAMTRSKREIPHYYLSKEINLRRATEWLADINAARPPEARLLMNIVLLKAVARALKDHPKFNGFYDEDGFAPSDGIHIGMAIAIRGGGLVAPALHDCDKRSLDDLMAALRDLVARVRVGSIRSSEISDPTVTVTSLGERGADRVLGVIYPPQVAIVGFGAPRLAPFAHPDGALAAEPIVAASLAADHRVTDGHLGARFLAAIDAMLQEPEKL